MATVTRFKDFNLDELKTLKSSLEMGDALDTKKGQAIRKHLLKELDHSYKQQLLIAKLYKTYKFKESNE